MEYWTCGGVEIEQAQSVLHVVKTLASTFRRVMSQKFGRDHNSTTTYRLCMYRWDRFMFWTGGGVEIEPLQSVLHWGLSSVKTFTSNLIGRDDELISSHQFSF